MPLLKFKQTNSTQVNKIWRKELYRLIKKIPDNSGLVTATVLNTKIGEVENKYQTLTKNTLLLLIIMHLQVQYLIRN